METVLEKAGVTDFAAQDAYLRFRPYTADATSAVAAFNQRIGGANPPFLIPSHPEACDLPKIGTRRVYQEIVLALEGDEVRGAYTLRSQPFSFGGRLHTVAACQMPISEGIVDKRYSYIGPRILRDALRRQPLLYGLGIGSLNASITRLERAMGWSVQVIPFFFRVCNPYRFFRNIEYLRDTWVRRRMLDAAAFSGAGWSALNAAHFLIDKSGRHHEVSAEEVSEFGSWSDEIWHNCRTRYAMTAARDSDILNVLYPPEQNRFIRIKVLERGRAIGWAVMLDTQMSRNKYFGDMRVGSIIDCIAQPEDAVKVVAQAARTLSSKGVDLMLSNQSHEAWCAGLRAAGFMEGPSNFILTLSQQTSALLAGATARAGIHINRADGDGPIHL